MVLTRLAEYRAEKTDEQSPVRMDLTKVTPAHMVLLRGASVLGTREMVLIAFRTALSRARLAKMCTASARLLLATPR